MNTNDPGREPEPTDAELLRGRADNLENEGPYAEWALIQDMIDRRGREYLSGARPMPEAINASWKTVAERLFTALERLDEVYAQENDPFIRPEWLTGPLLSYRAALLGEFVNRPMPDTPAPSTDAPVCGATTVVDGKFRTCELPKGHTSDHRTTLRGIEIWWPVDEPNAPVIGSNQCEHGHLARKCETCELNQAEAQIAALKTRNAELVAERDNLKGLVGRLERARMQPPIYPAKEAPDAE